MTTSDVPEAVSGSGSGRILPFLSDIRILPDLDMNKRSGSRFKKKIRIRFRPDPNWDPINSDPVSKTTIQKSIFQKQNLRNLKRVILYTWLNCISLLHASVIELIWIASVKIKHVPWLADFLHVTNLHLFKFILWNKHLRNATVDLCCKIKNYTTNFFCNYRPWLTQSQATQDNLG